MPELKFPKIDFQRIHPTILLMKGKSTQAKVSLYLFEVIMWLERVFLYLSSYRQYVGELKEEKFIKELIRNPTKRLFIYKNLLLYIEEVVVRLAAIKDKIAQTALVYYKHPDHLGTSTFKIKKCPRCENPNFQMELNEKTCNFGSLLAFLQQEKVNDELFNILKSINRDKDIKWVTQERNTLLHKISKYYSQILGIYPANLNIQYENKIETTTFQIGGPQKSLAIEAQRLEKAYNKIVEYIELMEPVLFPKK